ncbi:unnamed protein product [Timema podura]|uniref:Uncharacterized protein n=1 Tax=Timema podura TaxID=61482 RepID=A0ABN7NK16_TIMPD|nr:unnamed protein product [Timema podura]
MKAVGIKRDDAPGNEERRERLMKERGPNTIIQTGEPKKVSRPLHEFLSRCSPQSPFLSEDDIFDIIGFLCERKTINIIMAVDSSQIDELGPFT